MKIHRVKCNDCGKHFDVEYPDGLEGDCANPVNKPCKCDSQYTII